MTQPNRPQKGIIPLLIQEQLTTVSKSRVDLAVAIDVRSDHPGTRLVMIVVHTAFTDEDEEADIALASKFGIY